MENLLSAHQLRTPQIFFLASRGDYSSCTMARPQCSKRLWSGKAELCKTNPGKASITSPWIRQPRFYTTRYSELCYNKIASMGRLGVHWTLNATNLGMLPWIPDHNRYRAGLQIRAVPRPSNSHRASWGDRLLLCSSKGSKEAFEIVVLLYVQSSSGYTSLWQIREWIALCLQLTLNNCMQMTTSFQKSPPFGWWLKSLGNKAPWLDLGRW